MRAKLTIVMVMLVVLPVAPAMASTFFVAADGTGDLPTIQDAINASADGDTILLGDGVFSSDGNRDMYINFKGLTIRSSSGDPTACIIDCGGSGAESHWGFLWEEGSSSSVVEGLSITRGSTTGVYSAFGSAIYVLDANSVTVRGCHIYRNVGTAVFFRSLGSTNLENCLIVGNYRPGPSGVAGVAATVVTRITACTVSGNLGPIGGIGIGSAAHLDLNYSVVWGNCSTVGSSNAEIFANDGLVQIRCSVVDSSGVGSFQPGHVGYGGDNVFTNPLFCDPAPCEEAPTDAGDYHVDVTSPCLPPGNPCAMLIGALGVNCTGATPTVDTSWGAIKEQYRGQSP